MTGERPVSVGSARLPIERIDRIKQPLTRFLAIETVTGAVLLLFTVAALVLSNSPWANDFLQAWETHVGLQVGKWEFGRSLKDWINDGLMTLFFFTVALELKRELALGELRNPRMAALSICAAVGGMLVPASFYLMLQVGQPGQHGWGTVMATDTAFVIGCLAVLGRRIPQSLRIFMLSLAIVDDLGAILVVAVGYSSDIEWRALGLAGIGIATVRAMAILGFRSFSAYTLVGVLVWVAVDASGIHPTVTGVVLGLMTPARRWISDDRLYAVLGQVIAHPEGAEGSGDTKNRETLQLAEVGDGAAPLGRARDHAPVRLRQCWRAAGDEPGQRLRRGRDTDRLRHRKTDRRGVIRLAGGALRAGGTPA